MKKSLRFVGLGIILIMLVGCATMSMEWMNSFEVKKVISVPNKTKNDLYIATNLWAVDAFRKSDSVIEFSDKDAGVIKGKYIQDLGYNFWASWAKSSKYYFATVNNEVRLVITITSRDEEVEITLNNPTITSGWSISQDELRATCEMLIASLEKDLVEEISKK